MADITTAERYARALVELAAEEGAIEHTSSDVLRVYSLLTDRESPLLSALAHPGFSPEERMAVLNDVLAILNLRVTVANFLRVVLEKGRAGMLPLVLDAYLRLADAQSGRVRAKVTTAMPLSDGLKELVRQALSASVGKEVIITERIDASILGGVIAEVEGRVFDGSVRSRLDALRQELLSANLSLGGEA